MKFKHFLFTALFSTVVLASCGGKQGAQSDPADSSKTDIAVDSGAVTPTGPENTAQANAPMPGNNAVSTSNENGANATEKEPEAQPVKAEPTKQDSKTPANGAQIEIRIVSIDAANNQTKVELINRMDEGIMSVSGRLELQDKDGNPITYSNGTPVVTPFQQMKTPFIVGPKSSATITLGNKLRPGTEKMNITTRSAKTTSGKMVKF